jgi:hypothetical protein
MQIANTASKTRMVIINPTLASLFGKGVYYSEKKESHLSPGGGLLA